MLYLGAVSASISSAMYGNRVLVSIFIGQRKPEGRYKLSGILSGSISCISPVSQTNYFSMFFYFFFFFFFSSKSYISSKWLFPIDDPIISPGDNSLMYDLLEKQWLQRLVGALVFNLLVLNQEKRGFSLHAAFGIRVTVFHCYLVSCRAFSFTKSGVNCWYFICV